MPSQITATFWEKGKPIALDVAASAKAATNAVAVLGSCADGVLRIPAPADLEDLKSLKALELGWPDPQIAKTGLGTMATFDHMVIPLGVENPRLGQVWLSETGTIRAVFAACSLTSLGNLLAMVEGASQGEATPPDEEPPGA